MAYIPHASEEAKVCIITGKQNMQICLCFLKVQLEAFTDKFQKEALFNF